MEYHSIQFTTISINVEIGIVKILFKYRYFQDLLIDIDIDIFQNHHIDIDIKSVNISTIDMSYRYIEQGYMRSRRAEVGGITPCVLSVQQWVTN